MLSKCDYRDDPECNRRREIIRTTFRNARKRGDRNVCFIDGEFTLKRVEKKGNSFLLKPANPKFKPIAVTEENRFDIWGIVTYAIKKIR